MLLEPSAHGGVEKNGGSRLHASNAKGAVCKFVARSGDPMATLRNTFILRADRSSSILPDVLVSSCMKPRLHGPEAIYMCNDNQIYCNINNIMLSHSIQCNRRYVLQCTAVFRGRVITSRDSLDRCAGSCCCWGRSPHYINEHIRNYINRLSKNLVYIRRR